MKVRSLLVKINEFMSGGHPANPTFRSACAPPRERRISVMVWGCITYHGAGTLCMVNGNINAQKYISILDDNLWPVVARHFNDKPYRFQDDNAPVHRARSTKNYIQQNSIYQPLNGQHNLQTSILLRTYG